MAAQTFLRDHPELRPFLLSSAKPTGRTIGTGSYGSVEEVAIPGAICAAKTILDFFQDPRQMPRHGIEKTASKFVRECQLMSTLRHPHIVQFLGVCFLPGSQMPALVMEKLVTSLHDILDSDPPPTTRTFIPTSLKRSILHDVARGLSFLHSITPEPIIHRDLSARNILLNEGMVAKIADLGMARIVSDSLRPSTMTKAPGASIYMPPEALEDKSRYDTTIDIFSLGILAIFIFSQMFPDPLAAAYMDEETGRMVGRTELDRRGKYMAEVRTQFQEGHPIIRMIRGCLKDRLRERPNICQICRLLEEARGEVVDVEFDVNKLSLTQLLQSSNTDLALQREKLRETKEEITILRQENTAQSKQIISLEDTVRNQHLLQENRILRQQNAEKEQLNQSLKEENAVQRAHITSLEELLHPPSAGDTPAPQVQWPLSLNWRQGKDIPTDWLSHASTAMISGKVYCGGDPSSNTIIEYSPDSGDWSELPIPPVEEGFAMTSFKSKVVLVGGGLFGHNSTIRVWDSSRKWVHPYLTLPTDRTLSAAVCHQKYLSVACGYPERSEVDVLDISSSSWYSAQPVPVGGRLMSSVVLDDCWYLSSFGKWKDGKKHIFWSHLPTLISTAISTSSSSTQMWHELPTPPVTQPTLLAFHGHLLLVGGRDYVQEIHRYDQDTKEWMVCGQLPIGMWAPCCAVLPSGDLMVAGGMTGDTKASSKRMWIANLKI